MAAPHQAVVTNPQRYDRQRFASRSSKAACGLGTSMSWDIPIGTEFAGYRITSVLGRGGMSVVYTAEHVGLGRTVALKLLSASLAAARSFRQLLTRQSRRAAALA